MPSRTLALARRWGLDFFSHAGVLLVMGTIVLPIVWIMLTAFKTPRDVYSLNAALLFTPTLENLYTIFAHPWNLGDKILNSLIVSLGTVVLATPMATMAAYAFSRFEFPFKKFLFLLVIASQFIPESL